jgi:dihydrofolate reductase
MTTTATTTRTASVLYMSMSLDGYIADQHDFLGGDDGHRLHDWFAPGGEFAEVTGPAAGLIDEMKACGALVAGRRTAELMDHWGGSHNGLPIFVPTHRPPAGATRSSRT